jgi:pimeloyl-ACP methyl ester carboxylesterase
LIFIHGACGRDAAWWWAEMSQPLADHGIGTVAVPLSSCGETGDELGDLYADVDACRHAITAAEGPVVLCGHSYGGVIITEAGAADRVTELLYVTSVMPDAGQSQADLIGSEPAPWLQPGDDGTVGVDPDMISPLPSKRRDYCSRTGGGVAARTRVTTASDHRDRLVRMNRASGLSPTELRAGGCRFRGDGAESGSGAIVTRQGPPAADGGRRMVVVGGQRVSPAVAEIVGWRRERTASMISLGSIPWR